MSSLLCQPSDSPIHTAQAEELVELDLRAGKDEEETAALMAEIAEVRAMLSSQRAAEEDDSDAAWAKAEAEIGELKAQLAAAQRETVAQPEKAPPPASSADETPYSGRGGESFFSSSAEVWFNRKSRLSQCASPRNIAAARRMKQQAKVKPARPVLLSVASDSDSDDPYADILNASGMGGRR